MPLMLKFKKYLQQLEMRDCSHNQDKPAAMNDESAGTERTYEENFIEENFIERCTKSET